MVSTTSRRWVRSGWLLLLLWMLVGCSVFQPRPTTPTPTLPLIITHPPETPPVQERGSGGNLIMPLGYQDPPTLDPALVGDVTSAFVVSQLFSGLVQFDENLEVIPDLADYWNISEDRTTYTFYIRDNAQFADGTPITAKDIRYSLERATDPDLSPYLPAQTYLGDIVGVAEKFAGEADEISGIQVPDSHTIVITIDKPKSHFLAKLAHPTSYVVDRAHVEKGGADWTENPNGSGPFMIERWDHDRTLILQRNLNYYNDLALLERVTFLMGASASNPMVLYENGDIDVTSVSSFALARVRDENNPLSQELHSVPQLSLNYIGMNVNMPPFDDVKVRQAFALLIDRMRLAEVTFQGSVVAARGILPPGMPGYNEDLPAPEVDIDQAKALLAESKYGGAENLPLVAAYGGSSVAILQEIVSDELGIEMEVRNFENFGEYLQAMQDQELPMFATGWIADYPDPENFLDLLFRGGSQENHSGYDNPEVDSLLNEAATEEEETIRWKLYQEAEELILEDASAIPIYHDIEYMLVKPYVKGLTITPMGIIDLSTVELVR